MGRRCSVFSFQLQNNLVYCCLDCLLNRKKSLKPCPLKFRKSREKNHREVFFGGKKSDLIVKMLIGSVIRRRCDKVSSLRDGGVAVGRGLRLELTLEICQRHNPALSELPQVGEVFVACDEYVGFGNTGKLQKGVVFWVATPSWDVA